MLAAPFENPLLLYNSGSLAPMRTPGRDTQPSSDDEARVLTAALGRVDAAARRGECNVERASPLPTRFIAVETAR